MKKTLGLSLLIGGGLVLSGCSALINLNTNTTPVVETKTMAFQATTALTMVNGLDSPTMMKKLSKIMNLEPGEVDIPVATLDLLFTNGSGFTVEQRTSDREGYTNLDVISFKIGESETITYSLYYNIETFDEEPVDEPEDTTEVVSEDVTSEEIITEEIPTEVITSEEVNTSVLGRHGQGNGHGHDNHDADEEDEPETDVEDETDEQGPHHHGEGNGNQEDGEHNGMGEGHHGGHGHHGDKEHYRVRGIAVVGDEEYRFMSKTETDTDGDEQEVELKFMMFKDEANFISIKQEIETQGVEGEVGYEYEEDFKYMVVKDGELAKQFKLEIEHQEGAQELEVKIDGVKYEVTYEVVEERTFIHVTVRGQGEFVYEKVVTTNPETSEVVVEYVLQ